MQKKTVNNEKGKDRKAENECEKELNTVQCPNT